MGLDGEEDGPKQCDTHEGALLLFNLFHPSYQYIIIPIYEIQNQQWSALNIVNINQSCFGDISSTYGVVEGRHGARRFGLLPDVHLAGSQDRFLLARGEGRPTIKPCTRCMYLDKRSLTSNSHISASGIG